MTYYDVYDYVYVYNYIYIYRQIYMYICIIHVYIYIIVIIYNSIYIILIAYIILIIYYIIYIYTLLILMNPRVPWMPLSKCLSLRGSLVWLPWERRPLLASRNVPAWSTWKACEKRRDGEDLWEMIMTYSKIMCHKNDDDDIWWLYIRLYI